VIILTGSGDTRIRLAAEQLGVAAFLTKPFSPTALQRRVQKIFAI
jgi:FixJ family two-component response regulator